MSMFADLILCKCLQYCTTVYVRLVATINVTMETRQKQHGLAMTVLYIINITTHFIFYLSRFWMDQHMGASKKNTENDDMFHHKSKIKIKLRKK